MIDTPQDPFEHFEPLAPVAERKRKRRWGAASQGRGSPSAARSANKASTRCTTSSGVISSRGQDSLHRLIFLFEKCDEQVLGINATVGLDPRDSQRPLHDSHGGLGERSRA